MTNESATMAAAEKLFGDVLVAVNGASPLGISIRGQARERLVAVLLDALQQAQAAVWREARNQFQDGVQFSGQWLARYCDDKIKQIEARAGEVKAPRKGGE